MQKSRSPEDIARAEQLRILQRKCNQVQSDLEQTGQLYIRLTDAREDFLGKMECLDDAVFETLLQEGRRLLAERILDECPLCEQELIDQGLLLAHVEERLSKLGVLTLSKRALQTQKRLAIEAAIAMQRDLKLLEEDLLDLKMDVHLLVVRSALKPVDTWRKQFEAESESQKIILDLLQTPEIQALVCF